MPTLTGHLASADNKSTGYHYVPFDVPAGIRRLDVRYAYSHPRHHGDFDGEGNTIDLGLFDARGHDFLTAEGFRGWSGSDRSHIWVGESDAETTPGYLSGPIREGRWHVILGLYRLAPEGCDYSVTIDLTPAGERPPVARAAVGDAGVVLPAGERPQVDPPRELGGGSAAARSPEPAGTAGERSQVARAAAAPPSSDGVRNPEPVVPAGRAKEERSHPARGAGWYRGDLQSHTHHSDAQGSLATLAATARARGLDFLAVTDHNTISHFRDFGMAPPALLLIPAIEITTYYGHMNVWGVHDWLDFRASDAQAMQQIIAAAHRRGALASVNHPKTGGPPWEYGSALDFDCIEVWQAPWPFYNTESFGWWESLLQQGRRVVAVGGSDYHQPEAMLAGNPHLPGNPTTWVYAPEFSVAGILEGIRRGHVFISADVDGPRLYFTARGSSPDFGSAASAAEGSAPVRTSPQSYEAGDVAAASETALDLTLRVQNGSGLFARLIADGDVVAELPVDTADWTHTWPAQPRAAHYIRAEVIIRHGPAGWVMAACTNPIYY